MSAFSSIYSNLTGLFGFSKGLNNASNNVANINTPGYKGRDLNFRELTREDGSGVGVGVYDSSVRFQQGDINGTGNVTDLAINGEGFFVLRDGADTLYSRSGQFQFDEDGYLVDPVSGGRVAALGDTSSLEDIRINRNSLSEALATSLVAVSGSLDSGLEEGTVYPGVENAAISFDVIDSIGQVHTLQLSFTKLAGNRWAVQIKDENNVALGNTFDISFDSDGNLLEDSKDFLFSFQPFTVSSVSAYEEYFNASSTVTVTNGDLSSAGNTQLDLTRGTALAVRSESGEGIDLSYTSDYRFNEKGQLIDPSTGRSVVGLSETGELVDFTIEDLLISVGSATTQMVFSGNLDADLLNGDKLQDVYNVDVFDSEGDKHSLSVSFTKSDNNSWNVQVKDQYGNTVGKGSSITYDESGLPTASNVLINVNPFDVFDELPTTQIFDNGEFVTFTRPGDLSSASTALAIGINDVGKEAAASFLLRDSDNNIQFLSSASLSIDSDGFLVDAQGLRISTLDSAGMISDIDLDDYLSVPGEATTLIDLVGNLDPSAEMGSTFPADLTTDSFDVVVFDSQGKATPWQLEMEKTQVNQWQVRLQGEQGTFIEQLIEFDPVTGEVISGGNLELSYQPTRAVAPSLIEDIFHAPAPINVTDGDPTSAVSAILTLDQDQSEGGAFLTLRNGSEIHYQTEGNFVFDSEGYLIDDEQGLRVAALSAEGEYEDINIQSQLVSSAQPTTAVYLEGQLDYSDAETQLYTVSVFDANGDSHDLTLNIDRVSNTSNQWNIQVVDENGNNVDSTKNIIFTSGGSPLSSAITVEYDPLGNNEPVDLRFNFFDVTAPITNPQPVSLNVSSMDGRVAGSITQFDFTDTGEIKINYSNGDEVVAAQLAIREHSGPELSVSMAMTLTQDNNFGSEIRTNSVDGQASGDLNQFSIDSSGNFQFAYSNELSVAGPQLAFVQPLSSEGNPIALDFSNTSSVSGEDTNLAIEFTDGESEGKIGEYYFDENGLLQITYDNGISAEGPRIALFQENGNPVSDIRINFAANDDSGGLTSAGTGSSNVSVSDNDGRIAGRLVNVIFDNEGYVVAEYSNGEVEKLQRVALANFTNKSDLRAATGSFFTLVDNSGLVLGYAGDGAFGSIEPSSLELSNVDLTSEFGNIIIIQRGYQATSQAMNATNEIIEELYNTLKGR